MHNWSLETNRGAESALESRSTFIQGSRLPGSHFAEHHLSKPGRGAGYPQVTAR